MWKVGQNHLLLTSKNLSKEGETAENIKTMWEEATQIAKETNNATVKTAVTDGTANMVKWEKMSVYSTAGARHMWPIFC